MKNNNNEDNFFKNFKYNYDNTPGFDSVVKIGLFLLFSIVVIIVAKVSINEDQNKAKDNQNTTKVAAQTESLKKIIDSIKDKNASIEIKSGDLVIKLENLKENESETTAFYLSSTLGTKKIKIFNGESYELAFENEFVNNDLFPNINYKFIIPSELIKILETNKNTINESSENITYTYNYEEDDITTEINLTIIDNDIKVINITNEKYNIEINYR